MLWEVRARFITRLGHAVGNQRILQYVTDGMKLDPVGPTLVQARDAILAAVKTGCARDLAQSRVVRIKDTLHMSEIFISEAMLPEARANPAIEVLSSPAELMFDASGNLI